MTRTPRLTQPRRWAGLALASVTLAAHPGLAHQRPVAPVTLARTTLASPNTQLWLAQAQGGEAGEAGITADASAETAYLAELAIIEGHMLAARDLYAIGQVEAAVELSNHPQEEGDLDPLRQQIADHGAADPAPAITAFTAAMQSAAPQAEVDAALTAVSQAFAAAAAPEVDEVRARFDAVVLVLKAAAGEYEASIENGAVADIMGWHEAYSFVAIARRDLQTLSALALSAKAAPKAITALAEADAAFGDPGAIPPLAGDPQILLGVAAKVELIASSVR